MSKSNIESLLSKSITGELSTQEKIEFDKWLERDGNRKIYKEFKTIWIELDDISLTEVVDIDVQKALNITKDKIKFQNPPIYASRFKRRPYLIAACIAVLTLLFGGLILSLYDTTEYTTILAIDNREILLPDNSIVYLNKGSELKYADDFNTNRFLKLTGKGMFDVVHNPDFPFVVSSENMAVTVLGTKFIVNAESNQQNYVRVIDGKVKVHDSKYPTNKDHILVKDDVVARENDGMLMNDEVIDNSIFWASKVLRYKEVSLVQLFKELSEYYNVEIEVSEDLRNCPFTGIFSDLNISSILENLKLIYDLSIEQEDRKVLISGNPC